MMLEPHDPNPTKQATIAGRLVPEAYRQPRTSRTGVMWRLAWRLLCNHLRVNLTRAWLRTALMVVVAVILWFSLAVLTATGLDVLAGTVLPAYVMHQFSSLVLGALAVILAGLVAFSAGLCCYLELFRAPDNPLLLCSPLSAERIFAYKWLRTLIPGLWMMLLLPTPVLTEWLRHLHAPGWSYGMLVVMLGGLLVLAGSFACLVCLLVAYSIPGQSKRLLIGLVLGAVLLLAWWLGAIVPPANLNQGLFAWLRQLVRQLRPMQWFLAPSRWWSSGLVEAAAGNFAKSLFFAALLWSNALVLYLLTVTFAGRIYRRTYATIAGLGDRRGQPSFGWSLTILAAATSWFSRPTRALLRKDLVTLCRDPVQWAQLGILACVLAIYFWTVFQFGHETIPFYLRRMLHLFNLAMVALTLATWASRFVYPLVAQEIRTFWLLGMSPVRRSGLLWSKWLFTGLLGTVGALAVTSLSHWVLQMDASSGLLHTSAAVILGLTLAGVSVSLGGLFVEPHAFSLTQPLSSYGNTLTLLVCTALALLLTGLAGLPVLADFQTAIDPDQVLEQGPGTPGQREWLLCLAQLLVGGIPTLTLLYLGQRRLNYLEW